MSRPNPFRQKYVCFGCTYSSYSKHTLLNHMRKHTDEDLERDMQLAINQQISKEIYARLTRLQMKLDMIAQAICKEEGSTEAFAPANDLESFLERDQSMSGNSGFDRVKNSLNNIGGDRVRIFVFNSLRQILSDEVAVLYSLSGKVSAGYPVVKRKFADTNQFKALMKCCNQRFPESNVQEVRSAVSDWLNQAKTRLERKRHEEQ
ncbi:hypothetical protein WDU94_005929 [Cyamophila willieti]